MATTTIGFGVVLILLGLAGFFGTGSAHPTALIPAVFGILLAVLGAMAKDEKRRKLAMHIAVTVGLLGFLGTVTALFQLGSAMSGEAAQPVIAAGERAPLEGDVIEDLAEGDRHHREIDAAAMDDERAQDRAGEPAQERSADERQRRARCDDCVRSCHGARWLVLWPVGSGRGSKQAVPSPIGLTSSNLSMTCPALSTVPLY